MGATVPSANWEKTFFQVPIFCFRFNQKECLVGVQNLLG